MVTQSASPQIYYAAQRDPGFFHHAQRALLQGLGLPPRLPTPRPLSERPEELLEATARASLLIPVRSAGDVERAEVVSVLTPVLAKAVNDGRVRLCFDYSNESGTPGLVETITALVTRQGIRRLSSVFLFCQNRLLKTCPDGLQVLHFDYFLVSCWSAIRRELTDELVGSLVESWSRPTDKHDVLCLNATPRLHRVITVLMLAARGYLPRSVSDELHATGSLISFPGFDYVKQTGLSPASTKAWLKTNGLSELVPLVDWLQKTAPLTIDQTDRRGNGLANVIYPEAYLTTKISVVTETGTGPGIRRITEKTFKPLTLGHPFVVIGHPNTLDAIRELGFDLFEDVIDHSYDLLADSARRIAAALDSAESFIIRLQTDEGIRRKVAETSRRNIDWGLDGFAAHYSRLWAEPILRVMMFED